jgi:hypothetical protein
MTKRPIRLTTGEHPILDVFSLGRVGPSGSFSPAQIEQIRRTVRRVPEVMVKVTGGGGKVGAVAAHLAYISRKGELAIETDEGTPVATREAQRELLADWHLELSAGQYRGPRDGRSIARRTKLVHNIVLSMPSPTPPEKILAAARKFAREKFGDRHRYAMVLHTDQRHPHVHMVVKAESEEGRRLHIDKAMLRVWREDFAQLMREQGVAANATPRFLRGRNKGKTLDAIRRAQQYGVSTAVQDRVAPTADALTQRDMFDEPIRGHLIQTRKSLIALWDKIAETLDLQGEVVLAGDVRHFARHLPTVRTDDETLAVRLTEERRATILETKRNIERTR